jgi:hypothetical protein
MPENTARRGSQTIRNLPFIRFAPSVQRCIIQLKIKSNNYFLNNYCDHLCISSRHIENFAGAFFFVWPFELATPVACNKNRNEKHAYMLLRYNSIKVRD